MALLDDILTKLQTDNVVDVSSGFTGYKSYLPNEPDQAVAILETGGREPDKDFAFPTFQVLVRAGPFAYDVARAEMDEVFQSLHNATISGYVYVFAISDPTPVGYDQLNRPVLSLPLKAMKALP
jgi:hypothetical protein